MTAFVLLHAGHGIGPPPVRQERRAAGIALPLGLKTHGDEARSQVRLLVIFRETPLAGAYVIELEPHRDERGWFARSYCEREFADHGLPTHFPQSNLSFNRLAGTLRGMHYNLAPFAEAKLVRPAAGAIYDVVVDLRQDSPTRWQSFGVELSAAQGDALFVPAGFAHGFITLVDDTVVHYQMGEFFNPEAARGFRWNDPKFSLVWPRQPSVVAPRDASYPDFVDGA